MNLFKIWLRSFPILILNRLSFSHFLFTLSLIQMLTLKWLDIIQQTIINDRIMNIHIITYGLAWGLFLKFRAIGRY